MAETNWELELNEYIRQGEPHKVDKSNVGKTATGLIHSYYEERKDRAEVDEEIKLIPYYRNDIRMDLKQDGL